MLNEHAWVDDSALLYLAGLEIKSKNYCSVGCNDTDATSSRFGLRFTTTLKIQGNACLSFRLRWHVWANIPRFPAMKLIYVKCSVLILATLFEQFFVYWQAFVRSIWAFLGIAIVDFRSN